MLTISFIGTLRKWNKIYNVYRKNFDIDFVPTTLTGKQIIKLIGDNNSNLDKEKKYLFAECSLTELSEKYYTIQVTLQDIPK